MIRFAAWLAAAMMLAAPAQAVCRGDNRTWVDIGGTCLAIDTFGRGNILVVFLHGNTNGPNDAVVEDFRGRAADLARRRGIVAVAMTRPGYLNGAGRRSEGDYQPQLRRDSSDLTLVAAAIERLRAHHRARRVVVMGFSGGARLIARIIQEELGEFDAALLYGCACEDPSVEIQEATGPAYPRRLDFLAITGDRDFGSRGGREFARGLARRGVRARFVALRGIGHVLDDAIWERSLKPALLRMLR